VVVPLAEGFEEIEAVVVIDVLRRAGAEVIAASLDATELVVGSHGIAVRPDLELAAVESADVDMVVLPGGMPGAQHLTDHPAVQSLLVAASDRGAMIAAICAAPMALGPSGAVSDKHVTSYPGFDDRFEHGEYRTERVVVDGEVITSRGPGTAMEFALTLTERLFGADRRATLAEAMLVAEAPPPYEA